MAIYDILNEVLDQRTIGGICDFNGYLEDYLSFIEDDADKGEILHLLQPFFKKDNNLKICVNLRLNINKDAIANQIIRYKDSFKLPPGTLKCPFIVYGKFQDLQKAIILTVGKKEEYILAKSFYYVMSEPENEYEGTRNELIATSINVEDMDMLLERVDRFFFHNEKAGIVQRNLDSKIFSNYDEMYALSQKIADDQFANMESLLAESEHQEDVINQAIATWFLLKKFSYVQYMMDKNNLNRLHEGNVKKQRQVAKEKCDAISFVSYSDLWKLAKAKRV